ncbi:hypothetical protein DM860_002634 [Cuscuta australis]|uniref:Uncharacterized protein n=1 Tax=Cuscuta australis TaxID=267555 RepID=A0A328CZM9_9ASTE|nr:hypothetical protein DM860_002634 [Cuscuta australis]
MITLEKMHLGSSIRLQLCLFMFSAMILRCILGTMKDLDQIFMVECCYFSSIDCVTGLVHKTHLYWQMIHTIGATVDVLQAIYCEELISSSFARDIDDFIIL